MSEQTMKPANGPAFMQHWKKLGTRLAAGELNDLVRRNQALLVTLLAGLMTLVIVFWLWNDVGGDFKPLYGRQELYDTAAVIETLEARDIPYQIHPGSGQILVPENQQKSARMSLATAGISAQVPQGMELLSGDGQFGRSQFMERAQFLRALEGELAQTVMSLRQVRTARVHLAVPQSATFIRNQSAPSAAVYVDLYPGVTMDSAQVQGIINLITGSLPRLTADHVTVLDQNSNPLSGTGADSNQQLDLQRLYIHKLESDYEQRLSRLIEPLVGPGNLRVVVNTSVDFSYQESTKEQYDPQGVLKSESVSGSVPAKPDGEQADNGSRAEQGISRTRDYELDRAVSYQRQDSWRLQKVNVAVVLNNKVAGLDGKQAQATLDAIHNLLINAAGIDKERGDQITIQALPFAPQERTSPGFPASHGLLEKLGPNASLYLALGAGALALLVVIFCVMKLRRRKQPQPEKPESPVENPAQPAPSPTPLRVVATPSPADTEERAARMRDLANQHPERVASVLETWIKEEK